MLLQVIHFRNAFEAVVLQSSQGLPELLFYMKKSYRILQLQFQLQFYKGTHTAYELHPSTYNLHVHTTSTSREFSIQNTILHAEDKELFEYYYYITEGKETFIPDSRNSTHRKQGDLLEMHPCVLQDLPVTFQAFQPQVLTKATPVTPVAPIAPETFHVFPVFPDIPVFPDTPETFRTFKSFMTFQPFQAILQILQIPVSPGNPPHSSILRLECIFYIFYNFYSSIGFHRKLHRVPVEQLQTFYKHSFFKEREML